MNQEYISREKIKDIVSFYNLNILAYLHLGNLLHNPYSLNSSVHSPSITPFSR